MLMLQLLVRIYSMKNLNGNLCGVLLTLTLSVRASGAWRAAPAWPLPCCPGRCRPWQNGQARTVTEGGSQMKAIVVTDRAAGTAGMTLAERPEPDAARLASLEGANYGDVIVEVHASGFTGNELEWP